MKRIYLKPEVRLLQLRLNKLLTTGSGSGDNTKDYLDEDPIGDGNENSRSWGQKMWDDM